MQPSLESAYLDPEQVQLFEWIARTAEDVLAPIASAGERGRINRPLLHALAERGILRRLFLESAPGRWESGVSALDLCVIRESLATRSTAAETALALQGLGGFPILKGGHAEIVRRWIPKIASGEAVAAFALTEPGAGSDVGALGLVAEQTDHGFALTGEKAWISNAPDADIFTVFARTGRARGAHGLTAFAVPASSPGLTGERIALLSPHPIGRLRFEEVEVGPTQILGTVNGGFRIAMETLNLFRPSVGAFAIGMAQAAIDAAVEYATQREAFGRRLHEFQAISHSLADVNARVAAARLLVHQAAYTYDANLPIRGAAAMAKLVATEIAQQAVDVAIQVHGARALEEGHLLEHLYREVRAPRIYEGTSEIQREIIARQLFAR
jgi:acyl-CoA dehydrogenase